MSTLQIRNVPEPLKRDLRRRARSRDQTMSAYVLDLIQRDLEMLTPEQIRARLAKLRPVTGVSAAELLEEARLEREAELS